VSRKSPASLQRGSTGRATPEEFEQAMPDAQALIDSIERDISHVRNLDPALLASLVKRLDELRAMVG